MDSRYALWLCSHSTTGGREIPYEHTQVDHGAVREVECLRIPTDVNDGFGSNGFTVVPVMSAKKTPSILVSSFATRTAFRSSFSFSVNRCGKNFILSIYFPILVE